MQTTRLPWRCWAPSVQAAGTAALGLLSLALGACRVQPYGAGAADLGRAKDQASLGAALFAARCEPCHGARGEGQGAAPALMGDRALPRYPARDPIAAAAYSGPEGQPQPLHAPSPEETRPEFVSALDLEAYLVDHMPKLKRQPLSEPDYWNVVQFILVANGRDVPPGGLTSANAARAAIHTP